MVRNIVFDLGGVLINLNRIKCLRAFDEIVGYKDFGAILSAYRQIGFFEKFETGEISARQFRNIIRLNSNPARNGGEKREVTDRDIDYSLNCYLYDLPQDKIETLLFYRTEYRLFLLSNTNPIAMVRVREMFEEKGYRMEELFERIFLSYQMKDIKPNHSIFNQMARKASIDPRETLFVDDSPANVRAAEELGYFGLVYQPREDLYERVSLRLKEIG